MGKNQDLEDAMEECTSKVGGASWVGGWGFLGCGRGFLGWWGACCYRHTRSYSHILPLTPSQVDTLDAFVHQLIDSGNKKANSVVRKPLAGALSFMLVIVAFALATMQQITIILR